MWNLLNYLVCVKKSARNYFFFLPWNNNFNYYVRPHEPMPTYTPSTRALPRTKSRTKSNSPKDYQVLLQEKQKYPSENIITDNCNHKHSVPAVEDSTRCRNIVDEVISPKTLRLTIADSFVRINHYPPIE